MELLMEIIGWAGAAAVLTGYGLVSMKRVLPDGWPYQSLNIGGSIMLAAYGFWHEAYASFAVNVIWLVIGLATLIVVARKLRLG